MNPNFYNVPTVHEMVVKCTSKRLQAVAWHSPEYHRQGHCAGRDERGDPQRPPDKKLLNIRFANTQGAERRGLGLAEEDEHRVQLVLVGDEE